MTILEFDELPLNSQTSVLTGDRGPILGRAVLGGGGAAPTLIEVPMDDDAVFNGDGSGGALQLGPITIVTNATDFGVSVVWDFQTDHGEQDGWIVVFAIDNATSGGHVEVRSDNVAIGVSLDFTTAPNTNPLGTPFAIYKFTGGAWSPLSNSFANIT